MKRLEGQLQRAGTRKKKKRNKEEELRETQIMDLHLI